MDSQLYRSGRGVAIGALMLRVAHLWRQTAAGGSEATFWRLYQAVDKTQIQFDFLVEKTGMFVDTAAITDLGGRVILIPPVTQWRRYQRELTAIFQREHYDIVHAHMNELSVLPLRIAKKVGIPVRIAHAHSGANWRELTKTLVKRCLRLRIPRVATHYMAVSEQAGRQLFGIKALQSGQVMVLPNALHLAPLQFDAQQRETMRQNFGLGNNQFVIGHVGRLGRQKNQAFLLRLMAAVVRREPTAVLLLIGDGAAQGRLQRLAQRLQIASQVHFVPAQKNLVPYYQAMDCFVLPSLYEGLPGVGVEAQANGLPCLLAATITPAAKINDNVRFLPLKRGVRGWADAILQLRQQPRQVSGRATAWAIFDTNYQAQRLTTWYQQIAGGAA